MKKFTIITILLSFASNLAASDEFTVYDAVEKYGQFIYAKFEMDDMGSHSGFYPVGGRIEGGCWISERGSIDTLYGPNRSSYHNVDIDNDVEISKFDRMYSFSVSPAGDLIHYNLSIKAKIDTIGTHGDTVASVFLVVTPDDPYTRFVLPLGTIDAGQFSKADSAANIIVLFELSDRVLKNAADGLIGRLPESVQVDIAIATTGKRRFNVEKITIYDQIGIQLVENPIYIESIGANLPEVSVHEGVQELFVPSKRYELSNAIATGEIYPLLHLYRTGRLHKLKASGSLFGR